MTSLRVTLLPRGHGTLVSARASPRPPRELCIPSLRPSASASVISRRLLAFRKVGSRTVQEGRRPCGQGGQLLKSLPPLVFFVSPLPPDADGRGYWMLLRGSGIRFCFVGFRPLCVCVCARARVCRRFPELESYSTFWLLVGVTVPALSPTPFLLIIPLSRVSTHPLAPISGHDGFAAGHDLCKHLSGHQ